jgi:predicted helicase
MEQKARIYYISLADEMRKEEKLAWLKEHKLKDIPFETITPDAKNNWINLSNNDFEELLPLFSKEGKTGKNVSTLFKLFSRGIETGRDEWVYDISKESLVKKVKYFITRYNESIDLNKRDLSIKWSSSLDSFYANKTKLSFDKNLILETNYRLFNKAWHYVDKALNHRLTQNHYDIFGSDLKENNVQICLPGLASPKEFHVYSFNRNFDFNALPAGSQSLPLYRYDDKGNRHDNITDWGLEQFRKHYTPSPPVARKRDGVREITKEDIFHYTYAVLHNPAYRIKYELNLKREFPRIPFYENFSQWCQWGKQLMELHINYESAKPFALKEITSASKADHKKATKELFAKAEEPEALYAKKEKIKVKLKANKETGVIEIDELTLLSGVPAEAWEYKLGNRSALEWVLDQYKEKKPSDPTIAEKFNTYRFADYKAHVIELLKKVCTVSVETMKVIREMEKL